jgi:hypothetical protein
MTEIIAVLKVLPAIITAMKEFYAFMHNTFGDTWPKYLQDSSEAFKLLKDAKTPEQKIDAARAIQNLIHRT